MIPEEKEDEEIEDEPEKEEEPQDEEEPEQEEGEDETKQQGLALIDLSGQYVIDDNTIAKRTTMMSQTAPTPSDSGGIVTQG